MSKDEFERLVQGSHFLQQLLAEILHANGEALGLIASAIAKQGDASALKDDLRSQIEAAKVLGMNNTAIGLATRALAAIEAEAIGKRGQSRMALT